MPAPKASDKLQELLNRAVASELAAIIQYMWQHVTLTGLEAGAVGDAIKGAAMVEMKHAERIAERLNYLGGMPTVKPDPIYVGGDIPSVLKLNVRTEETAIALYQDVIAQAKEDDDHETALMFREIILDEQGHHDMFLTLLGQKDEPAEPRIGN